MKNENIKSAAAAVTNRCHSERGPMRTLAGLALFFLLGLGAGLYWSRRSTTADPSPASGLSANVVASVALSEPTQSLLQRLETPVEIRFHSVLNQTQAAAPWSAFARRVSDLLAEYQNIGAGKIAVTRSESRSAARADGLEPLQLDKGNLCFIGLTVSSQGQRAVIPRLAPEWEAALEFDLSRAIARVGSGSVAGEVVMNPAPVDTAATEELRRTMPKLESLSLAEATLQLRTAGLEEFKAVVSAMQAELKTAQQRLAEAQSGSVAATESARKNLQQIEAAQTEKLAEISHRLQTRISALEQLKRGSP